MAHIKFQQALRNSVAEAKQSWKVVNSTKLCVLWGDKSDPKLEVLDAELAGWARQIEALETLLCEYQEDV